MNIAFSIETPERVPINSGSHGKHQPTDDGTTPCNLIEKYQKIRSFTLELCKPLEVEGGRRRSRCYHSFVVVESCRFLPTAAAHAVRRQ